MLFRLCWCGRSLVVSAVARVSALLVGVPHKVNLIEHGFSIFTERVAAIRFSLRVNPLGKTRIVLVFPKK